MTKNRRSNKHQRWLSDQKQVEKLIAYIFGLIFIITLLVLAILFPEPTSFQYLVFRIVLSLAAAGIASMIPGFIEVQISTIIRAGGSLAVFVLVYFYNPASLVSDNPWISELYQLRGDLGNIEGIWERLDESEVPCARVRELASSLGDRFSSIEDKNFHDNLGAKIEKYRYAQYAYLIASDVECEVEKAKEYARKSIQYGSVAIDLAEQAKKLRGQHGESLRTWLDSDFTKDRIYFHNALGHALLYRYGVSKESQKINVELAKIRSQYYVESGITLEENPILKPLLNSPVNPDEIIAVHPCAITCGLS